MAAIVLIFGFFYIAKLFDDYWVKKPRKKSKI